MKKFLLTLLLSLPVLSCANDLDIYSQNVLGLSQSNGAGGYDIYSSQGRYLSYIEGGSGDRSIYDQHGRYRGYMASEWLHLPTSTQNN
jgi:hypothetical protein